MTAPTEGGGKVRVTVRKSNGQVLIYLVKRASR